MITKISIACHHVEGLRGYANLYTKDVFKMEHTTKNIYVLPDSIYTTSRLRKYAQFGTASSLKKGAIVFKPGDVINRLIYIVSGSVRISMVSDDGQEQLLYTADAGSILGLLFGRKDEPTCVVALDDCVLTMFTAEQLKAVCQHDPDVILELLHNATDKTSYFMSQLATRKWFSADIRILQLIYHAALEKGVYRDDLCDVPLKFTQKTISEITGVHFVTVSRCLKNLKELGIAEKVKTGFWIYDMEQLKQLIDDSIDEAEKDK